MSKGLEWETSILCSWESEGFSLVTEDSDSSTEGSDWRSCVKLDSFRHIWGC